MASTRRWEWRNHWIVLCYLQIWNCVGLITGQKSFPWTQSENTESSYSKYNVMTDKLDWWEASQECSSRFDGHLAVLKSGISDIKWIKADLYWVGALTYSKWIWKDDGRSIYSYIGIHSTNRQPSHSIVGNSVLACHQFCGEEYNNFGLQGNNCFCLDPDDSLKTVSDQRKIVCSGNYDEFCGNDAGISVYKLVNILFAPENTSQCAYVGISIRNPYKLQTFYYHSNGNSYYPHIKPEGSCVDHVNRFSACSDPGGADRGRDNCVKSICLEMVNRTYTAAANMCSLLSITHQTAMPVTQAMVESVVSGKSVLSDTYWIGLERKSESKWIDGTVMNTSVKNQVKTTILPTCLAVIKWMNRYTLTWLECSTKMPSICETISTSSSSSTTTQSQTESSRMISTEQFGHNRSIVSHSGETTVMPENSRVVSTSSSSTTTQSQTESSRMISTEQFGHNRSIVGHSGETTVMPENSGVGVYVGAVVGSVVVLAAIVFLIISLRQGQFCFGTKSHTEASQTVKFNSPTNLTSLTKHQSSILQQPATTPNEHCAISSSIPSTHALENGHYENLILINRSTSLLGKQGKKNSKGEKPESAEMQHKKDVYEFGDGGQSSHWNSAVTKQETYELACPMEADTAGYYSVTDVTTSDVSGEYSLANTSYSKGTRTCSPVVGDDVETQNTDSEYNILGQHLLKRKRSDANAYDYLGRALQEDDYDTAGVSQLLHKIDDTYDQTDGRQNHVNDACDHRVERDHGDNYDSAAWTETPHST